MIVWLVKTKFIAGNVLTKICFQIGSEVSLRNHSTEVPVCHFRCRFCAYAYVSSSGLMLEQHARMLHHLEIANEKSKAASTKKQVVKDEANGKMAITAQVLEKTYDFFLTETARQLMSFQNLMSGLTSASMMAAAQSSVTNLLAGSQTSGSVEKAPEIIAAPEHFLSVFIF